MLIVSTSGRVTGLANAGRSYVSDSANQIRVYNTDDDGSAQLVICPSQGITVDANGNLWIIQAKTVALRLRYCAIQNRSYCRKTYRRRGAYGFSV